MLTTDDINLMSRTYTEEIAPLRTVSVIFIREIEVPGDPYQRGKTVSEEPDDLPTDIVWTHVKTVTESGMTSVVNGILIEKDDVIASVPVDVDLSKVVKIKRGNNVYRVMTTSPLGIGEINRIEILLRLVT